MEVFSGFSVRYGALEPEVTHGMNTERRDEHAVCGDQTLIRINFVLC